MTYTPTTEQVRDAWTDQRCMDLDGDHAEGCSSGKAFDRWLTEHDQQVKAQALEEAADRMDADPEFRDPLRLKSQWLRDRAQQLKEES